MSVTPHRTKSPTSRRRGKSDLGGRAIMNRMVWLQGICFLLLVLFIWIDDELLIPLFISEKFPLSAKTIAGILDSLWVAALFLLALWAQMQGMRKIKLLEGILCVCANCKKIRDEAQNWQPIEEYIQHRSDADFSHSICPDCGVLLYGDLYLEAVKNAKVRPK